MIKVFSRNIIFLPLPPKNFCMSMSLLIFQFYLDSSKKRKLEESEPVWHHVGTQCDISNEGKIYLKYRDVKEKLKEAKKTIKYLKSNKYLQVKLKEVISRRIVLPGARVCVARGVSRPRKYDRKDVAAAGVLKAISPKAFRLIRKRKWMNLPSESVIRSWLKMFTLSDGVQTFLMDVITTKHKEPKDMECFLAFDEMALKERWVYDKVQNNKY